MKLSLKDIPQKLAPALQVVKRYLAFIFAAFFLGTYAFLMLRINTLARTEPDDDAVAEKLQTVQRPKLDQSAVDRIEQLEDQSVDVKTLFNNARQNPFSE